MATISKLVVSLSANSAKLVKNLQKSRKSINRWAKNAAAKVKAVGKVFGALGVVALGGFIIAVNRSAAAIDKMVKSANKLKFPIEDYQRFAHIADLSGVSMDNFGKGMQRMLKTVGDARDGLSTATKAFDALGLNWDDLAKQSPSKQFELIAAAMKTLPTQADKVKVAMDIFGRSGADLLNVFESDIGAIGKEFDALGVTITAQQAAMVEAYQDSKTVLGTIFSGFTQQVTAEVAPALTLIVKKIKEFIINAGGVRNVAKDFAVSIVKGIAGAVKGFASMIRIMRESQIEILDTQAIWEGFKSVVSGEFITAPLKIEKTLNAIADKRFKLQMEVGNKSQIEKDLKSLVAEIEATFATDDKSAAKKGLVTDKANKGLNNLADAANTAASKLNKKDKTIPDPGKRSRTQQLYILENLDKYIAGTLEGAGKFDAKKGLGVSELVIDGNKGQDSVNIAATTLASQETARAVTQLANKEQSRTSLGQLTINMVTDAGKIAGEIFGEPAFLTDLKAFVDRQANDSARQAAGG